MASHFRSCENTLRPELGWAHADFLYIEVQVFVRFPTDLVFSTLRGVSGNNGHGRWICSPIEWFCCCSRASNLRALARYGYPGSGMANNIAMHASCKNRKIVATKSIHPAVGVCPQCAPIAQPIISMAPV
jgi:hypothetical protein